jgi:hypothetical protein
MTTATTTNPYPQVPAPTGAADISEWTDVGTPDAYRTFSGPLSTVT